MIRHLVAALTEAGLEVDAEAIADALWLAKVREEPAAGEQAPGPDLGTSATEPRPPDAEPLHRPAAPAAGNGADQDLTEPEPVRGADSGLPGGSAPVTVPEPRALPDALELGRALRPLKRRRRSRRRHALDADATVDYFADTGVLAAVMRPAAERWFDVDIVVDAAPSMTVWRDTVAEFTGLLRRHGAFREVRRWSLGQVDGEVTLTRAGGTKAAAIQLADPQARRITLVVSDCVAPMWYQAPVWAALRGWGLFSPAAVLSPLPDRLWPGTALGSPGVTVRSHWPGAPNRSLDVTLPWWWPDQEPPPAAVPLPVFTLDPAAVASWARMVMGAGGAGSPAVFAEPPVGAGATPAVLPGRPADAEERVSSFRVTVSPGAYQLAVRLSAVLHGRWQAGLARALQRAVLPGSGQVELAEVLLGGLVRQAERRDGQEEPEFEFLDGVGAVLQRTLTGTEALGVLQAVAGYLERETGASPGIAARLLGEAQPAAGPGEFAGVREAAANLIDTMGLARPQPSPSPPPSEAAEEAVAVEGAAEVAAEAPVASAVTSGVLPPSDAPSASQLTQVLYLNVSAPERIPLGGRASVIIGVSEGQADAQAALSVPFRELALSAADRVMSMSLHLSGLDLVSEESASIMVLATGHSEPKRFEVRATGTGAARVRVTVLMGGTLVADAHLDITVEPRVRRRAEDQPAELGDRTPAPELPPGPRHALIVATGLYRDQALAQLRSPVDDAEGLAAVLGDLAIGGFTVRQLTNPVLRDLRRALYDFLEDRSADDTVLVYLSCHGLLDPTRRLYLAATDTNPERLAASAIPATDLTRALDSCRAQRQVLVLDCCFSGAFGFQDREATTNLSQVEEEAPSLGSGADELNLSGQLARTSVGREVITASGALEYAFDVPSSRAASSGSVFTIGLVEGLRTGAADANGDGYITVEDAYRYASRYVRESGLSQTPQRFSDAKGPSIVLARNPRGRAVVPAAPPDDGQNAQETSTPASRPPASPTWDHVAGLSGHLDSVFTLAFSPDGRLLATGGADGTVRTWDPSLAIPLHTLTATRNPVNALAFSPDGRLLATGGADGAVWIWDPATGSLLQTLAPPDGDVFALAFRPDGLLAGSVGDNVVVIWDLADVARARGLDAGPGPVRTLAFSRDGLLATGGGSQPVRIWDVEKNLRWELPSPQYAVNALAFSPDGRLLATGGEQGVQIWDPFTRGLLRGLGIQRTVGALAFSPDSRLLAMGTEGLTDIGDVAEERLPEALLRVSGVVRALAFSPDGRLLAIGSSTGAVELWRTGLPGDQRAAQGTQ